MIRNIHGYERGQNKEQINEIENELLFITISGSTTEDIDRNKKKTLWQQHIRLTMMDLQHNISQTEYQT